MVSTKTQLVVLGCNCSESVARQHADAIERAFVKRRVAPGDFTPRLSQNRT